MTPTAYINGKVFTGQSVETDKVVLTEGGQVLDVVAADAVPSRFEKEDLKGLQLSPALIDLQIYGGNEKMFSHELSEDSLEATRQYCLAGGCSHFMITMATNTLEKFLRGIETVKSYWNNGGKGLLGLHLEGPYINPVKRGAHLENCIRKAGTEEVQGLLERGKGVIKMITIAPELCPPPVTDLLLKEDIIVSAGHTNATYEEATSGFNKGIPAATHLYNAMSPLQHRAPGMVGAVLDHSAVMSSIVCDGIHVDYPALRIAKKVMGSRLFYITDAVAEIKTGEYQHIFRSDRYTLPDGTLSGSALTMMQCVKNGMQHAGISLEESLRMASTLPGQLLRHKKLGRIEKGYEASLVAFDDDLQVVKVY